MGGYDDYPELVTRRVYPGANGAFTMYQDDGKTYAYEQGQSQVTTFHWDDAARRLSAEGAPVGAVSELVEVEGR